ncbi:hypothetical protein J6590_013113 [Homalodisca vitripennis]|nr:hypothetical protein J6590_013113 [Homalodisca vitripennis]
MSDCQSHRSSIRDQQPSRIPRSISFHWFRHKVNVASLSVSLHRFKYTITFQQNRNTTIPYIHTGPFSYLGRRAALLDTFSCASTTIQPFPKRREEGRSRSDLGPSQALKLALVCGYWVYSDPPL